jgi:hypothetical protein
MNKKAAISTLFAVGLSLLGAGVASARSVPGLFGAATTGGSTCFNANPNDGSVLSVCGADFVIPAEIDTTGNKSITFTSRAAAAGSTCRAVKVDRLGGSFAATPTINVPVAGTPQVRTTTTLAIGATTDTLWLACTAFPGTSTRFHEMSWTP